MNSIKLALVAMLVSSTSAAVTNVDPVWLISSLDDGIYKSIYDFSTFDFFVTHNSATQVTYDARYGMTIFGISESNSVNHLYRRWDSTGVVEKFFTFPNPGAFYGPYYYIGITAVNPDTRLCYVGMNDIYEVNVDTGASRFLYPGHQEIRFIVLGLGGELIWAKLTDVQDEIVVGNTDGTYGPIVIYTSYSYIYSLAVDRTDGVVYWMQGSIWHPPGATTIRKIQTDATGLTTFGHHPTANYALGSEVKSGHFYFGTKEGEIQRVDKNVFSPLETSLNTDTSKDFWHIHYSIPNVQSLVCEAETYQLIPVTFTWATMQLYAGDTLASAALIGTFTSADIGTVVALTDRYSMEFDAGTNRPIIHIDPIIFDDSGYHAVRYIAADLSEASEASEFYVLVTGTITAVLPQDPVLSFTSGVGATYDAVTNVATVYEGEVNTFTCLITDADEEPAMEFTLSQVISADLVQTHPSTDLTPDCITDPVSQTISFLAVAAEHDGQTLQCEVANSALPSGKYDSITLSVVPYCAIGHSSPTGHEPCTPCSFDFFQHTIGQTSCIPCPGHQGTLSTGSTSDADCIDICQPGTSSGTGLVPCTNCALDYIQNMSRQTSCYPCPPNQGTTSTGEVECLGICQPGTKSATGLSPCTDCTLDYYQDGTRQTTCIECPTDQGTLQISSTAEAQCLDICQAGTSSGTGLAPCTDCALDYYQDMTRQTSCNMCPTDKGTLTTTSTAEAQCLDICQPGTSSATGLAPCIDCALNYYQDMSRQTSCFPCPPNQRTTSTGKVECLGVCQLGTSSTTGLSPCTNCPLDYYQSLSGATECLPCSYSRGTLQEASHDIRQCLPICHPGSSSPTGFTTCTLCPRNFYQPNRRATGCIPCPAYTSTNQEGATSCLGMCEPGHSSSTGLVPCTECSPGYYQPNYGATECLPCVKGSFTAEYESVECTPCEPGSSQPTKGASHCELCDYDFYQDLYGAIDCAPCPVGATTREVGSISVSECQSGCQPGESSPTGLAPCTPCDPGSAEPDYHSTSCDPCSPGSYQPDFDTIACNPCPPGSSQSRMGEAECVLCDIDFYQDMKGSTECKPCPMYTSTSETGSDEVDECLACLYIDRMTGLDHDQDGLGDECDPDDDNDDILDVVDNCHWTPNTDQANDDRDTFGNACDNCNDASNIDQIDSDGDGHDDPCDNCPNEDNVDQADYDKDGYGDVCDSCPYTVDASSEVDADEDHMWDSCDNCPGVSNRNQMDVDTDNQGDVCDNCPETPNPSQEDTDDDGIGDACDNCVHSENPGQEDTDGDGLGDVCEMCDGEISEDGDCIDSVTVAPDPSGSSWFPVIIASVAFFSVITAMIGCSLFLLKGFGQRQLTFPVNSRRHTFTHGDVYFKDNRGNTMIPAGVPYYR